ncbi:MAG TPA: hypothetical protein VGP68_19640 [Gemmataceae bacterium]|nr:hypothetical protein [Gemmataceae bacterium]
MPVQKELKLSDEEVTKAKETVTAARDKFKEERDKLNDLDPQERFPKMAEIGAKEAEETYTMLAKDWKPEQVKRLKQLGVQFSVQMQGVQAFMSPAVDKALKLTDDQKEKIRALGGEQREERTNLFQNGGDPAENQKKMAAMTKEFVGKGMAMLTDDQKKEWKELTGDPFEFPAMAGGGRGGKGKRKKDKDKDN